MYEGKLELNEVEMAGKTADEALERALKALDAAREEVEVTVLDPGSKGFLGLGQKPAKVFVKLKPDPVRTAKNFLRGIAKAMGLDIAVDAALDDRNMNIDLKGSNMGVLIGKHGSTLDSLQYLTNLAVNKNTDSFINVQIDTENYRQKRRETLESLARSMAKKARQTKRPVRLEPMSPAERRIIHATLQGEKNITTYSEGIEPFRNVVVAPKREAVFHNGGSATGGNEESIRPRPYSSRTYGEKQPAKPYGEARKYGKYSGSPSGSSYAGKQTYAKNDNYGKFIKLAEDHTDDEYAPKGPRPDTDGNDN